MNAPNTNFSGYTACIVIVRIPHIEVAFRSIGKIGWFLLIKYGDVVEKRLRANPC